MIEKTRVLFICIHNSGRSQMAETFLKAMAVNGLKPKVQVLNLNR